MAARKRKSSGKPKRAGRRRKPQPRIWTNSKGELCIGLDCYTIRVPENGDIKIDVEDCPAEFRERIRKNVQKGARTLYRVD